MIKINYGKKVLAIFTHTDDAELMCAGTLSLLKTEGMKSGLSMQKSSGNT